MKTLVILTTNRSLQRTRVATFFLTIVMRIIIYILHTIGYNYSVLWRYTLNYKQQHSHLTVFLQR